jgi:hypothetical protein
MQRGLADRLMVAVNTPKTGGVLLFENYIDQQQMAGAIGGMNATNARNLLRMVWGLYNVSGYIIQCIQGKTREEAEAILAAFMGTVRNTLGTERQPWGGGNLGQYADDHDYFRSLFSIPVNYLNTNFAAMNPDERFNMLTSNNGWNHQKGTAQLAEDIFSTDYNTPVAAAAPVAAVGTAITVPVAILLASYYNEFSFPLVIPPAMGETVIDGAGQNWIVANINVANATLNRV